MVTTVTTTAVCGEAHGALLAQRSANTHHRSWQPRRKLPRTGSPCGKPEKSSQGFEKKNKDLQNKKKSGAHPSKGPPWYTLQAEHIKGSQVCLRQAIVDDLGESVRWQLRWGPCEGGAVKSNKTLQLMPTCQLRDHLLLSLHAYDVELPEPFLVFEQGPLPNVDLSSDSSGACIPGILLDLVGTVEPRRGTRTREDRLVSESGVTGGTCHARNLGLSKTMQIMHK